MNPFSLYVHIPFCRKKCRYCDFYSVPYDAPLADRYLDAITGEITLLGEGYAGTKVRTVYIGGGTPSTLSPRQLSALCASLRKSFDIPAGTEWTVECNPESFSREKAGVLLDCGVNRLTFGFQSLDDRELAFLGRAHDAARCRSLLADGALAAFDSAGIDIMYGLPGQTVRSVERSLGPVFESPYVKHCSAYELTVADGTPLGRRRARLPLPSDETMAAMTSRLWELLEANGFRQYEVSNFAKTGHECRHNTAYWRHEPYLGLGCAAHSFFPPVRSANVRDVSRYIAEVRNDRLPRDFTETLDPHQLGTEILFLGLRTAQGVDEALFLKKIGKPFVDFVNKGKLGELTDGGFLLYEKPFWRPTRKGLLAADGIARKIIP